VNADPYYVGTLEDAAALIVSGHRLDYVLHEEGRLWFFFLPDQCIADDYINFRHYRLPVDARRLVETIAALRAELQTAT
jgi:hypothetical protein